MSKPIDLNADLGEDESAEGIKRELAIMEIISSCNIACGGHAGSTASMERTLKAALKYGVAPGAHPSYPDRENFGRQSMAISPDALRESIHGQMGDISGVATKVGAKITHLKLHGALYNDAQDDEGLANLLVDMAGSMGLAITGMHASCIEKAATEKGVPFIAEAFIDRQYNDNSRLVARNLDGAVIATDSERQNQALSLASGSPIETASGKELIIAANSLCIHSDSDGALNTATTTRKMLEESGFAIRAPIL